MVMSIIARFWKNKKYFTLCIREMFCVGIEYRNFTHDGSWWYDINLFFIKISWGYLAGLP